MSYTSPSAFGGQVLGTNGNDFAVNVKNFPALQLLPPISGTEIGYQNYTFREVYGTLWVMQNADYGALGFFQINSALPSYAFALLGAGGLAYYSAAAGVYPGFTWTLVWSVSSSGSSIVGNIFQNFDTVSLGYGGALTQVSARIPLMTNFVPSSISIVAQAVASGSTFNIVYGEGNITTPTAANATASNGNSFFVAGGITVPSAGTVGTYTPLHANGLYTAGGELTLRFSTPAGTGTAINAAKVVILGTV